MKTRNGFISNSSSTSFIAALKTDTSPCPHCGRSDPDLFDIVDNLGNINPNGYETTKLRCRGVEGLEDKLVDRFGFDFSKKENKELNLIVERAKRFESLGYKIGYFEVSYHDETTNDIIRGLGLRGTLRVIWDDHNGFRILYPEEVI